MKKAIFLYDYTGIMAQPWVDAGYDCYLFDGQHPAISRTVDQNPAKIGKWFDPYNKLGDVKDILEMFDSVDFIFGFPECTDLTVAGAKHFNKKRQDNPFFQLEAIELADLVRCLGNIFNCPWAFENPVGVLSTQYRPYDFKFNPCDYGGYLPKNDVNPLYPDVYPPRDAYNKGTCIWHGNGFRQPKKKEIKPLFKENPGWKFCGGKSLKTKNIRSATPRGFAQAVFEANHQ